MAYQSTNTHSTNTLMSTGEMIATLVAAPFKALFNGLVYMSEQSSQMKALTQLGELSDEELAARGTSRSEAVQRILRAYY